jgi:hypothetical protein
MSAGETLKEFLKQKKKQSDQLAEAAHKVDWEARRKDRVEAVSALFGEIERWLQPSREEGLVTVAREPHELSERHLGRYVSEKLTLDFANVRAEFVPVGDNKVVGASAQVDASCGPYELTLIHLPGQGWRFLRRGAVVTTFPVTEESFTDALKELLEE